MTDLAEEFVNKGAEVSIITSCGHYLGQNVKLKKIEIYNGIKIYRVLCTNFGKRNLFGIFADYLSFYLSSILKSLIIKKHDFVITLSTPPLISLLGILLKRLRKNKFIYWTQDIYPDIAINLGVLKTNLLLTRFFNTLAKIIYKEADKIVVLGEFMKKIIISKNIEENKIFAIHNWSDSKKIFPVSKNKNWFINKYNLTDKFIILYSGNIGRVHSFPTILNGMRELKVFNDILLIFIGDGVKKKDIIEYKLKYNMHNIIFFPYQKREDLCFSLNIADIHLISLTEGLEGLTVPSKIYGIMAAGKPLIYIGPLNSEVGYIIKNSDCGFIIKEGDTEGFNNAVLKIYKDRDLKEVMGEKGRNYFRYHYDRSIATQKFFEILKSLFC